jgi:hypothetical protein
MSMPGEVLIICRCGGRLVDILRSFVSIWLYNIIALAEVFDSRKINEISAQNK